MPDQEVPHNFGVYFHVTNKLPVDLHLSRFVSAEGRDCLYGGPDTVAAGASVVLHLKDPTKSVGAEGSLYFLANIDGELREYGWYGDCPVWSTNNKYKGPGITKANKTGSPLEVEITIDEATKGWKPGKRIHHVFVLMLENRSFDHLLGFSKISGTDAETGDTTTINGLNGDESNDYDGKTYTVATGAKEQLKYGPKHSFGAVVQQMCGYGVKYPSHGPYPNINVSGYAEDFGRAHKSADPEDAMRCFARSAVPVLNELATSFAVCDNWASSHPGPTWPNRFFMMAGTSGGLSRAPSTSDIIKWQVSGFEFEHGSIFDAIKKAKKKFRIYGGDIGDLIGRIPVATGIAGISKFSTYSFGRFNDDLINGDYDADFTLIEPSYGNQTKGTYLGGNSQHALDGIAGGEKLIKSCYESIRNSPIWYSSMLIVTWDEHGGFYDHVIPQDAPKPGDKAQQKDVNPSEFEFDKYGARVPAVVVSPWITTNTIDHRLYDHASVPATVEALLGLKALTKRDGAAADVLRLANLAEPRKNATAELPPVDWEDLSDASDPPAFNDDDPLTEDNFIGTLYLTMKADIEASPPEDAEAIHKMVAGFTTYGEASSYMAQVSSKIFSNDEEAET